MLFENSNSLESEKAIPNFCGAREVMLRLIKVKINLQIIKWGADVLQASRTCMGIGVRGPVAYMVW